ncbi:MAG: hypothetical protein ACLQDV_21800 [Candidatus Binataceae bacterium]
MGALGSLSKSATVVFWYISVGSTFAFGTLFFIAWLSEEFAKSEKWKARRNLLIALAIIGVFGEQMSTIGEFAFSEHLQTIDERQISELTARVSGTFTLGQMSALKACLKSAPKGVVYDPVEGSGRGVNQAQADAALARKGISTHPARLVLELTPREWKRLRKDSAAKAA